MLKYYLKFIAVVVTLAGVCFPASSHTNFYPIFERHNVVSLLIRPSSGEIVDANQAAADYYGYSRLQLTEMNIQDINALSAEAVAAERALALEEKRNFFLFKHKLANGDIRSVQVSSVPVEFEEETLLYSIIYDVSDYRAAQDSLLHYQTRLEELVEQKTQLLAATKDKQLMGMASLLLLLFIAVLVLMRMVYKYKSTQKQLHHEKQRLDEVIWGTHVGTWEWHIPSGKISINERWAELIGYTLEELGEHSIDTWVKFCHPDDLPRSQEILDKNFSGELDYYEVEARMRHKDGHWIWVLDRGKVVEWSKDGKPVRMSGTHQDITSQKNLLSKLEKMAHYDLLTELPNRSYFSERASQLSQFAEMNRRQFALLFIDLNDFKLVNDKHGHEAGDTVLIEVGRRLRSSVRSSDLTGRLGGDEFAVVLNGISGVKAAEQVTQTLLGNLNIPYKLNSGQSVAVTASIGVACYPQHGNDLEHLLQVADEAMYRAKSGPVKGSYQIAPTIQ